MNAIATDRRHARRRVLIIDDDAAIRTLVERLLRRGIDVDLAADGSAALDRVRERAYDALLLDLMMPDHSGFDVIETLRSEHTALLSRTIVLTALARRRIPTMTDVYRVMEKPFDLDELTKTIEDCSAASPSTSPTARILIAESEIAARELHVSVLAGDGYSVDVATDGLEAIGRLEARSYAAVLLDLHLPKLDGMGVLAFLAERQPDVIRRVVMVTGLSAPEIGSLYPIGGTLPKPVSADRLRQVIRECAATARAAERS